MYGMGRDNFDHSSLRRTTGSVEDLNNAPMGSTEHCQEEKQYQNCKGERMGVSATAHAMHDATRAWSFDSSLREKARSSGVYSGCLTIQFVWQHEPGHQFILQINNRDHDATYPGPDHYTYYSIKKTYSSDGSR